MTVRPAETVMAGAIRQAKASNHESQKHTGRYPLCLRAHGAGRFYNGRTVVPDSGTGGR